jgi:hypothetical protein
MELSGSGLCRKKTLLKMESGDHEEDDVQDGIEQKRVHAKKKKNE